MSVLCVPALVYQMLCFGHGLFGRVRGAQVVTTGTCIPLFFSLSSILPRSFDIQTVSHWTAFSVRPIFLCMLFLSWLLLTWQDEVGIDQGNKWHRALECCFSGLCRTLMGKNIRHERVWAQIRLEYTFCTLILVTINGDNGRLTNSSWCYRGMQGWQTLIT